MLTLLTELRRHLITTMKCLFKTKCLCCYQYHSMHLVKSAHLNVSLRRICQVFDIYVQSNQKFWDKALPCQRKKKKSNFVRLTEIRSDTASRQQSEMLCRQTDLHCTSRQSLYQMLKIDGGGVSIRVYIWNISIYVDISAEAVILISILC